MTSGIISIIIGVIWFSYSFVNELNVNSAWQQTVQFLGYVCGSIFFVGGLILLKLNEIKENKEHHTAEKMKSTENMEKDTIISTENTEESNLLNTPWVCNNCGTENQGTVKVCGKCKKIWRCRKCGYFNRDSSIMCRGCGSC